MPVSTARAAAICVLALCAPLEHIAEARPPTAWSRARSPAEGAAAAIGGYSRGCLKGAERLRRRGPGYRLSRPKRGRNFGHPSLIAFVKELARSMSVEKLGKLVVGDLSQPRGGPSTSGHASHQSGLDADLWYLASRAHSLVDKENETTSKHWSTRVVEVLALAARDDRVARIFVHPVIKRKLCSDVGADRSWLRMLRPWWGHDSHFHVRLHCPSDSPECEPQPVLPEGDGCSDLSWWFSDEARADRRESRQRYRSKIGSEPELPAACAAIAP